MDPNVSLTPVPDIHLRSLEIALTRIGELENERSGRAITAQVGKGKKLYGNIAELGEDLATLREVLKDAGIEGVPAIIARRMLLVVQAFGPETPFCRTCGDLGIDILAGKLHIRPAGETCRTVGCGGMFETPCAAQPYISWLTEQLVPFAITVDTATVPGMEVPTSEKAVRKSIDVDVYLDELLRKNEVTAIQFLRWLYHGPEKKRFNNGPFAALNFLRAPLSGTFITEIVLLNWVKLAKETKGTKPNDEPAGIFAKGVPSSPATDQSRDANKKTELLRLMSRLLGNLDIPRLRMFVENATYQQADRLMTWDGLVPSRSIPAILDALIEKKLVSSRLFDALNEAMPSEHAQISHVRDSWCPPVEQAYYNQMTISSARSTHDYVKLLFKACFTEKSDFEQFWEGSTGYELPGGYSGNLRNLDDALHEVCNVLSGSGDKKDRRNGFARLWITLEGMHPEKRNWIRAVQDKFESCR